MKYITEHSGYAGAVHFLATNGGQLFVGKGKDGCSSVIKGKTVVTFWEPNSLKYHKCREAALYFNFPHEHFTPGRLARFILKEICGLDPKGTRFDPRILQLARDGFHWHYTHVEVGYHPYLLEFDLCAAYFSSLNSLGSFYFNLEGGNFEDNGALSNLSELVPSLPKWLRMTILGIVASHSMTFATMPNRESGNLLFKWNTISKVDYGAAFNQTHRAILRLHRCMQRLHSIGSVFIKRMHTDSFALSLDCPVEVEQKLFDYLDAQGFRYSLKAQGTSHFSDLNTGIIGRKFIGVPFEVREAIKKESGKIRRVHIAPEQLERWGYRGVLPDTFGLESSGTHFTPTQTELDLGNVGTRQEGYHLSA